MTSRKFDLLQFSTTIQWWLSFHSAIGRSYVLNESALKFPITEYLTNCTDCSITLEYPHPKLNGRKIDIMFKLPECTYTIELKYVTEQTKSTNEKQRIFDDLIRLHLANGKINKNLFLICGNQGDFISFFQRIKRPSKIIPTWTKGMYPDSSDSEGFYSKWFSFDLDNPYRVIDFNIQNKTYQKFYKNFNNKYSKRSQFNLPQRISTNLMYISQSLTGSEGKYEPCRLAVWDIT